MKINLLRAFESVFKHFLTDIYSVYKITGRNRITEREKWKWTKWQKEYAMEILQKVLEPESSENVLWDCWKLMFSVFKMNFFMEHGDLHTPDLNLNYLDNVSILRYAKNFW